MTPPPLRPRHAVGDADKPGAPERAVSVVFAHDTVLVVHRVRGERRYCVLPGGGVEPGEAPAAAAVRELREETGLSGSVRRHLATDDHADRRAHYYLVTLDHRTESPPGLREDSPEHAKQSPTNQYRPAWIRLADLGVENLQPYEVRALVIREGDPSC